MKLSCKTKKKLGIAICSIGIGVMLTVLIPCWGWLLFIGAGLVAYGWWIISNH